MPKLFIFLERAIGMYQWGWTFNVKTMPFALATFVAKLASVFGYFSPKPRCSLIVGEVVGSYRPNSQASSDVAMPG